MGAWAGEAASSSKPSGWKSSDMSPKSSTSSSCSSAGLRVDGPASASCSCSSSPGPGGRFMTGAAFFARPLPLPLPLPFSRPRSLVDASGSFGLVLDPLGLPRGRLIDTTGRLATAFMEAVKLSGWTLPESGSTVRPAPESTSLARRLAMRGFKRRSVLVSA